MDQIGLSMWSADRRVLDVSASRRAKGSKGVR
jgi:hypothetical protein